MKITEATGYAVFFTGLLIKFFHAPFHAYVMMAGIALLLVYYLVSAFGDKLSTERVFSGLCGVLWLCFLLFVVKYYPFAKVILGMALTASAGILYYRMSRKTRFDVQSGMAVGAFVLSALVFCLPTDLRYYLLNIKFNQKIEEDHRTWDRYSWFLFRNGKQLDAKEASDRALTIARRLNDSALVSFISEHNRKITDASWERYE